MQKGRPKIGAKSCSGCRLHQRRQSACRRGKSLAGHRIALAHQGREAEKEAYARGFKDGTETQLKRQRQKPDIK
jgi:hypothetical protein